MACFSRSCDDPTPSTSTEALEERLGFQPSLSRNIIREFSPMCCDDNDDDIDRDKFRMRRTDLERIDFVYESMQSYPVRANFEKDDEQATACRSESNSYMSQKLYLVALCRLNRAIANAKSTQEIGNCCALRSELFDRIGFKAECIRDCDRAFACQYRWKRPLVVRKRDAMKSKKDPTEPFFEPPYKISKSQRNPKIQCATKKVEIVPHPKFERQVVATEPMQFGEVIAVEKPFGVASLVNDRGDGVHCCHCMLARFDLIPCKNCTEALYCTEECRKEAFDMYHQYECPIVGTPLVWKNPPFHLALKITMIAHNDVYDKLDAVLANCQMEENTDYRSDRYNIVHNLRFNKNPFKINVLVRVSKCAAGLYHLVKTYTTFFNRFIGDSLAVAERSFKIMLIRLMQICMINDVLIMENPSATKKKYLTKFAFGIYPFYNVINHSCHPNVEAYYHGTTLVLRAILPIKKGEECLVAYSGCDYGRESKSARHELLRTKHGFVCICQACNENWLKENDIFSSDDRTLLEIESSSIIPGARELIRGAKNNREIARPLVNLVKAKLRTLEPRGKLHSYYQKVGRACYDLFANKRPEV